jgi:hypothetical protein
MADSYCDSPLGLTNLVNPRYNRDAVAQMFYSLSQEEALA